MNHRLSPPASPAEAIRTRRNPSYGFTIVVDIMGQQRLAALLTEVRDNILLTVDPSRKNKTHPIHSPAYIKQSFFHATILGSQPLLNQQLFVELYGEQGMLTEQRKFSMCQVLQTHLQQEHPKLEPTGIELIERDGTVVARFDYKSNHHDTPLLELRNQLDPDKNIVVWDAGSINRNRSITVTLCVIDIEKMASIKPDIQAILKIYSERLKALGCIHIEQFQFISSYDKRTLSKKHMSVYASVDEHEIHVTNTPKTPMGRF